MGALGSPRAGVRLNFLRTRVYPRDTQTPTDAQAVEWWILTLAERGNAAGEAECIDRTRQVHEGLMLGLPLEEGIDLGEFVRRYRVDLETVYAEPLAELQQGGFVEIERGWLRLTHAGRLVADAVLSRLLAAD